MGGTASLMRLILGQGVPASESVTDYQAAACPSRRGSAPADKTFVRG